jgi:hypothetical protein
MSLEALSHATTAPAFNGLFYATAAAVLPVLFLAIAVQGCIHEDLLKPFHAVEPAVTSRARLAGLAAAARHGAVIIACGAGRR